MADLTILEATQSAAAGLTPVYEAAAASQTFPNDGKTMLHFKNTNGATRDVAIVSQQVIVPGSVPANYTVTVPATTGDKILGPFDPTVWNDVNDRCHIVYSATTGVTVMAFHAQTF